ncbi:L-arabinose isomerase [Schnuerera sp. xch1]|uniref:L-arabinose isomerase n=1 Tax=Schnuerera sp. xch1 TaxID=2874283 RepID=UPI001CBA9A45|nr:L-arabinose isomerase [Schnuerera sp. xch1]MBZ2174521.1 L-arabinose isomerase [Schnuerera sp. xch1]
MRNYEFWFVIGSQHLYGKEVIEQVKKHGEIMVKELNTSHYIPWKIKLVNVATTPDEITKLVEEANYDENCAGIMTWMHTFSPSKMWIRGLTRLNKPYLHMNTQFNREIPWDQIDMDFMNLNQSAHGDREHGFIGARLRLPRKIVVGYWEDEEFQNKMGNWMRSAIGVMESRNLKVARFGDNMREVAVTEGDKVETQIKLGWAVNYHPLGDLVQYIDAVEEDEIDNLMEDYRKEYTIATDNMESVRYQARMELGMRKFLEEGKFGAFITTFEDLYGLKQLPGLAVQRLMEDGYGFGAEGDWKTAALTHIMKTMATGLDGGTSFMEDYTYHLRRDNELILGAHMLEVCPTIADDKPRIEVHELGIGGKEAPARMVFDGKEGNVILASLIDIGGRMRLIVNDAVAVKPLEDMPKLPVARAMWKPLPNLQTSAEAWLLAGGAHHTVMSYSLTVEHMRDFAEMVGIEFIHISKATDITELKKELMYNDIAWKLNL